jgi:hypothetical protein
LPGTTEGTAFRETVAVVGVETTVSPEPATTDDKVPVEAQVNWPVTLSAIERTWPIAPGHGSAGEALGMGQI